MNAKVMTRFAVFAVAGSLLAGCATQQGTNTAVGTGVGAGTGAALGAIFGGLLLSLEQGIKNLLRIVQLEKRRRAPAGKGGEAVRISIAGSGVEIGPERGPVYPSFILCHCILQAR